MAQRAEVRFYNDEIGVGVAGDDYGSNIYFGRESIEDINSERIKNGMDLEYDGYEDDSGNFIATRVWFNF